MNVVEQAAAFAAKLEGVVDDLGIGGEQGTKQVLLRGQAGGEGFVAQAALAILDTDETAQAVDEPAIGERERQGVGVTLLVGDHRGNRVVIRIPNAAPGFGGVLGEGIQLLAGRKAGIEAQGR